MEISQIKRGPSILMVLLGVENLTDEEEVCQSCGADRSIEDMCYDPGYDECECSELQCGKGHFVCLSTGCSAAERGTTICARCWDVCPFCSDNYAELDWGPNECEFCGSRSKVDEADRMLLMTGFNGAYVPVYCCDNCFS